MNRESEKKSCPFCGQGLLESRKCRACGRPYLLCDECEAVYLDAKDAAEHPASKCPHCGAKAG